VTVYQRHSKKCRKSKQEKAGQHKRCRCRFWLRWGKDGKRSAKTRSLEIATKAALRSLRYGIKLLLHFCCYLPFFTLPFHSRKNRALVVAEVDFECH